MHISHDIGNLKGNSTFPSWSWWNKFLKRFSGSIKECATEDEPLNHNMVNISFFKIDELRLSDGGVLCGAAFFDAPLRS